jgi:hypothetical protein
MRFDAHPRHAVPHPGPEAQTAPRQIASVPMANTIAVMGIFAASPPNPNSCFSVAWMTDPREKSRALKNA